MAYLIQRIDQSLEHDQMQDVTEVEKNNLSI
ncbi:hypothetical protein EDD72_101188 [Tepidibacillus fermentans]|uniref:Uncharacterized protein n=2 Tax=Tepidibacillus fermentans TaxID=1281767 RepID=A0A4V2UT79_9BACI|nr:hypothetical protein EDD72_101188 [Tepidibacillus fermentans]